MFVIELPLTTAKEAAQSADATGASVLSPATNPRQGFGKKVLVIDDEDAILQMVCETLSEEGYQVDTARDGESGLNRLRLENYDLTLCDWKMPGLTGREVYERLRAANPALSDRLIFITGDLINEKAQRYLEERKKVCLTKPFSLAEFRAAVGKALAAS
jgi:CheY-like chemotaxis protein